MYISSIAKIAGSNTKATARFYFFLLAATNWFSGSDTQATHFFLFSFFLLLLWQRHAGNTSRPIRQQVFS